MTDWERITAIAILILMTALVTSAPAKAGSTDSGWNQPVILAQGAQAGRVACLGEAVHAVWIADDKLYWSHSENGDSWTRPEVVSVTIGGGWVALVSSKNRLYLAWAQALNVGIKTYDGQTWTVEESVLSERSSLDQRALAVVDGVPHVFFSQYEHGYLLHTPGSRPLYYSVRQPGGWPAPKPVPYADNVIQVAAAAGSDGLITLAWIHDHMSWLGKNLGMGSKPTGRSIRAMTYDPASASWGGSHRLAGLTRGVYEEVRLAAGPDGRAYVFWMDGLRAREFGWRGRVGGRWHDIHYIDTDHKDARQRSGDIAVGPSGEPVIVCSSEKRIPQPRVVTEAGTAAERTFISDEKMTMGEDVRAVVSPSGVIHFVSTPGDLIYFRFRPPKN